jgi:hypothetical protein
MEEELEEVKRDIRKAKADLERAQKIGNVDLEVNISGILHLLLEKEKVLSSATTEQVGSSYKTPSLSKGSPKRNSTKQDSFRKKTNKTKQKKNYLRHLLR